jgi:hypothetical protein
MNAHALAQYQLRLQDEYDNMKKKYPIGGVFSQNFSPLLGPIMVDRYAERTPRIFGHYVLSGLGIELPASVLGPQVGGRRRKSRRANRSRKSRRR